MKYLTYFRNKINSIPIATTSKTVESILVRLFSAFTEIVESQINFLHQSNKLHLINNIIPLLQYARGNNISIDFYKPTTYYCTLKFVSMSGQTTWQGYNLEPNTEGIIFRGTTSNPKLINTVLIPANNLTISPSVDIVLYGVSDLKEKSYIFSEEEYLATDLVATWSDSIALYVNNVKWRRVKHVKEATTNSYIVTLNEFQQPTLIFPNNKPKGTGRIEYRNTFTDVVEELELIGATPAGFTPVITINDVTNYTGMPTSNELKNIVRLYYESINWTPSEVEATVLAITGITKAKLIRLEPNIVNIEISTQDNTLTGYLGLIEDALQGYREYTGDEVMVTLNTVYTFDIAVTINGSELVPISPLITNYLNNNTVLKLGDLYQLIEDNIVGNSQITQASFTPVYHVQELSNVTLFTPNTKSLTEAVILQVMGVADDQMYVYQILGNKAIFIKNLVLNVGFETLTLANGDSLQVYFTGVAFVGSYDLIEILPSLLTAGEIEPPYNFAIGNVNITYI